MSSICDAGLSTLESGNPDPKNPNYKIRSASTQFYRFRVQTFSFVFFRKELLMNLYYNYGAGEGFSKAVKAVQSIRIFFKDKGMTVITRTIDRHAPRTMVDCTPFTIKHSEP